MLRQLVITVLLITAASAAAGGSDVDASLFGDLYGADAAPAINSALKAARDGERVVVGAGNINIASPIVMDRDGQSLQVAGTLVLHGDGPALCLRASGLTVDLHNVTGTTAHYTDVTTFNGTAIRVDGDVHRSTVSADAINYVVTAIDITPVNPRSASSKAGDNSARVTDNTFDFNYIRADRGIWLDVAPAQAVSNNTATAIDRNTFRGGRLMCRRGVTAAAPSLRRGADSARHPRPTGNLFDCVAFEGAYSSAGKDLDDPAVAAQVRLLDLNYMDSTLLRDTRMSESLPGVHCYPQKDYPWMTFNDCRNITVDTKSGIYDKHIDTAGSRNVRNVRVGRCITDAGANIYRGREWMVLNSAPDGSCKVTVLPAVSPMQAPVAVIDAARLPATVSWTDLLPDYADGAKVLTGECRVTVPAGRTLTVDYTRQFQNVATPMVIDLQLGRGARLMLADRYNAERPRVITLTAGGRYRVGWTDSASLQVEMIP